jgi:protocatechuate 3,4-dioxygenase beta subunit
MTTSDQFAFKGVRQAGRDVTRSPINPGSEDIEIVVGEAAAISGVVTDRNGRPVPGCLVLAFTSDESGWFDQSPFVRSAQTSATGEFQIRRIAPGRYNVAPSINERDSENVDPAILEGLLTTAVTVDAVASQEVRATIVLR